MFKSENGRDPSGRRRSSGAAAARRRRADERWASRPTTCSRARGHVQGEKRPVEAELARAQDAQGGCRRGWRRRGRRDGGKSVGPGVRRTTCRGGGGLRRLRRGGLDLEDVQEEDVVIKRTDAKKASAKTGGRVESDPSPTTSDDGDDDEDDEAKTTTKTTTTTNKTKTTETKTKTTETTKTTKTTTTTRASDSDSDSDSDSGSD